MSEYKIRPAGVLDAVNLLRMLRPSWEGPETPVLPLHEGLALQFVINTIEKGFVLVVDMDGRLRGTIAIAPIVPPWSKRAVMTAMWFNVNPNFREREQLSGELLDQTEKLLDAERLPLMLHVSSSIPASFVQGLVERAGYQAVGLGAYIRAPQTGEENETSRLAATA